MVTVPLPTYTAFLIHSHFYKCFLRGSSWLWISLASLKHGGPVPELLRVVQLSEFFIDIKFFGSHYGPGVDSASNRNEYQEYFLGGKSGQCIRLTNLPPSCAVVTESGSLNFLEPSGPVQACNGTDLSLLQLSERAGIAGCILMFGRILRCSLYPSGRRFLDCVLYPCVGDIRWGLHPSPKMFINTIISVNTLKPKLNPNCHFLALLGAR